jgi:hypothetical protein
MQTFRWTCITYEQGGRGSTRRMGTEPAASIKCVTYHNVDVDAINAAGASDKQMRDKLYRC